MATASDADQCRTDVIAEIQGHKITRAELDRKQGSKLFQAKNQYYLAERDALNQYIDDYILEQKAQQEHRTVQELLQREVESKIANPTEDQLRVYYEGVGTEEPFESVRDKILAYIRQGRIKKARAAYVKKLRDQAGGALVMLAPPSADVSLKDASIRGSSTAPVVLVEFADYECPYCQQVYEAIKQVQHEFGEKVAIAFKDFPLPMHAHAEKAAEASRCAGVQGRFWEYHDLLFEGGGKLDLPRLKEYARTLGLDTARFDRCLDSGEEAAAVHKDMTEGQGLGLNGTPSFFVNGHFFSGTIKYEGLREIVERELSGPVAANGRP